MKTDLHTHIVFLKVSQVPDDTNPHQQCRCSQKDTAHVIVGHALQQEQNKKETHSLKKQSLWINPVEKQIFRVQRPSDAVILSATIPQAVAG